MNNEFFTYNDAAVSHNFKTQNTNPGLQVPRREEYYNNTNNYVHLASNSLNMKPTVLFTIFFSDDNIKHLRAKVVEHVKDATARSGIIIDGQGVAIQEPNIDNFFTYMLKTYMDYNTFNGSICFVNAGNSSVKEDIIKLNSRLLQEYVSKMVSEINMYLFYYKDASQLPEQLSTPQYTRMKGSRALEYNTGFSSGNSMGLSMFNQLGNV